MPHKGRVLVIAGSDSGGGAGIQADIKAITALGGYAATAITALTVQNTLGVSAVWPAPGEIVRGQIEAVLSDIGADALKIGMLGDRATVQVVAKAIADCAAPLVLDPVMIAKGGQALLADEAVDAVRALLVSRAALVTPNAPEATRLTGVDVHDVESQREAGFVLLKAGAKAALVKGGHIPGETVRDVLVTENGAQIFASPRIETKATHGTGCTLASALAARLALGDRLDEAVRAARDYLMEAIRRAPGFGAGHGPLAHGWPLKP
jgi:hydroxymethylpyrimidine/phosphomethylpyrimidine kinase